MKRLIKTQEDYEKALSRIEMLMDAEPDTPEVDELELLTALVKMYEDIHYPMDPPDPVEAIKFRMDQMGLSRNDLVPILGSKSKVSEVLNRKRSLTLAMMRALNKELGISAEVLLKEPGAEFPESMPEMDWSRFPLLEMMKRCWLPKAPDPKERPEECIRGFMKKAGINGFMIPARLRQGKNGRYNAKADHYSVNAWIMRILILARQTPLRASYVKGSINLSTMREIARLSYFDDGPLLAKEYLNKHGISLIVERHLPRTYLDGAAILTPDGKPVIGLTLRYDRLDNFWFSLLHELAHVARHLSAAQPVIVDDLELRRRDEKTEDKTEKEADELAMEASIPEKSWRRENIDELVTGKALIAMANKWKIHPAIVAGRIRYERKNYRLLSRYVGANEVRKLFQQPCQKEVE
jgi:HTH-type transcriptional regulator / antitoxin HigA